MKMGKKTTADLPVRRIGGCNGSRAVTITNLLKYIDAFDDRFVRVTVEKVEGDDKIEHTKDGERSNLMEECSQRNLKGGM